MKKSLLLFSALVLFVSCQTFKPVSKTQSEISEKKETIKEDPTPQISIAELDYEWYSSRANASIVNTEKQQQITSLNLFIVIKKDSIIYINANKMAIELGRIVLTPDSVKYINHLNATYYVGTYAVVPKLLGFPVDFFMLQSLLMNADFKNFENNFSTTTAENTIILQAENRKHKQSSLRLNQRIILNDSNRIIENHIIEKSSQHILAINYADFTNIASSLRMPLAMEINLETQKINVSLTFKNPKINVATSTYFKIPLKYKLLEF